MHQGWRCPPGRLDHLLLHAQATKTAPPAVPIDRIGFPPRRACRLGCAACASLHPMAQALVRQTLPRQRSNRRSDRTQLGPSPRKVGIPREGICEKRIPACLEATGHVQPDIAVIPSGEPGGRDHDDMRVSQARQAGRQSLELAINDRHLGFERMPAQGQETAQPPDGLARRMDGAMPVSSLSERTQGKIGLLLRQRGEYRTRRSGRHGGARPGAADTELESDRNIVMSTGLPSQAPQGADLPVIWQRSRPPVLSPPGSRVIGPAVRRPCATRKVPTWHERCARQSWPLHPWR